MDKKMANVDLEHQLEVLPDLIADELIKWRTATLEREKMEALLYLRFKGEDKDRSATEIKALIHSNNDRYNFVLEEVKAEANYDRLYERLMGVKKLADLRTAY
jgi:hypothetical protein